MGEFDLNKMKKDVIPDPFTGGTQTIYTNKEGTFMISIPDRAIPMPQGFVVPKYKITKNEDGSETWEVIKNNEKMDKENVPVIKKSELKDGAYYIGRTDQRGMPIGLWDAEKEKFQCIKPPQFGQFSLYEMNHIEDDNGFVCFEPVVKIELKY